MSPIRQLLDHLGHDALARLFQARSLTGARADKDRRASLARSYRGKVETFLHDLQRPELMALFAGPIEYERRRYQLARVSRIPREQLLQHALDLFAHGTLPAAMVALDPLENEDEDGDEDLEDTQDLTGEDEGREDDEHEEAGDNEDEEYLDEDDDEDDDEDSEDDDEGKYEEEEDHTGVQDGESLLRERGDFASITVAWSRPRQLRRLLEQLSMQVPERLRTPRFQELRGFLEREGFELGSEEGQLYLRDSGSPGIDARVRLRLREISLPPAPPWSTRLPEPRAPSPPRPPPPPPPLSPYEQAWRRLELLTGIPDAGRPHRPGWPGAFIEVATRGLALTTGQARQLTVVAASYGMGGHNPFLALGHLRDHLPRSEWTALLADLGRLNEAFPSEVAALREHIEQILGPEPPPQPAPQAPQAAAAPPAPPHATAPAGAAKAAADLAAEPVPAPAAAPPALNQRDLGLPGLFD